VIFAIWTVFKSTEKKVNSIIPTEIVHSVRETQKITKIIINMKKALLIIKNSI